MTKDTMRERGSTLVLYTVAMVAMMGFAALALDMGMLRKARAEAQRAADASALAGVAAIIQLDLPQAREESAAVANAKQAVDTNYMNGVRFDSASEITVQVIYDSVKVRTTVRRASVPTWFARVFGLNSFPVGAKAAAVADNVSGIACSKPLAIADFWQDAADEIVNGGDGDHWPDAAEDWSTYLSPPDFYIPANTGGDGLGTGLGSSWRDPVLRDWGMPIMIRPAVQAGEDYVCPGNLQGGKCYAPGWWGLWDATGDPGGDAIRDAFNTCSGPNAAGETQTVEPGWKQGPASAVQNLWNDDPNAYWDENVRDPLTTKMGSVVSPKYGANWRASKRVWIVAVYSPDFPPVKNGRSDIVFNNFMQFFFAGCTAEGVTNPLPTDYSGACTNKTTMWGRFLGFASGTSTGGPTNGTMIKMIRLVE